MRVYIVEISALKSVFLIQRRIDFLNFIVMNLRIKVCVFSIVLRKITRLICMNISLATTIFIRKINNCERTVRIA